MFFKAELKKLVWDGLEKSEGVETLWDAKHGVAR